MALTSTPTTAMQQAGPGQQPPYYQQFPTTTSKPEDINSIVGGMVDRSPWRWWDTWNQPLASPAVGVNSQINFFQTGMNQVDPVTGLTKTKLDTNMTQSGQFSPPYCLVMEQFGFYIETNDTLADVKKVFGGCWFEFKILSKIFFEGLVWMAPGAFGLTGERNGQSTDSFIVNGLAAPQYGYRVGKYARYIPPLTNFSMRLFFPGTPPTLASAFKLVCYLDGLSDNPVQ